MEQFWFVVEANSLAKEMDFERLLFKELTERENKVEGPASMKASEAASQYDEVSRDAYEQRPTYIA